MRLLPLTPQEAADLLPLWEPYVVSIADRCGLQASGFIRDIVRGEDVLHLIYDDARNDIRAVVITTFRNDQHGRKHCHAPYCTGSGVGEWFDLLDDLEDWARLNGAASLKTTARPGWSRLMKPKGYRVTHVTLEKDL